MKTAYIFHDSFSDPFSDWYPWTKTALEAMGYLVLVPGFPTPGGQSYASWKTVLKNYINTFDAETILIGHGTGGILALRITEELSREIHGVFLVASYAEKIGHAGYDRLNASFLDHAFDWDAIRKHAMVIKVFAGSDDPFVPAAISQRLADSLGETLQVITDGGHLNRASGFVQAIPIVQGIKESLATINRDIDTSPEVEQAAETKSSGRADDAARDSDGQAGRDAALGGIPPGPSPKDDAKEHPVHTMYEDLSILVNSNRGSVASALLRKARRDEEEKKDRKPSSTRNILYLLGTTVLGIAALGIAAYLFMKYAPVFQKPTVPTVPSLIQAETHQGIDIKDVPLFTLEKNIRTALDLPVTNESIRDVYYTNGGSRISFADLLTTLGISTLPGDLAAQFDTPYFMHGVGSFGGTTEHFLVIPVSDYDAAFEGMRSWEPTMMRDMGILMNVPDLFLKTRMTRDSFHDEIINNRNVRVLRYHAPADVTLDETPSPAAEAAPGAGAPETGTALDSTATLDGTSPDTTTQTLIFDGLRPTGTNPLVDIPSPYRENDLMLAYFFLNQKTLVVTDGTDIIPEILKRYANSQIYVQK